MGNRLFSHPKCTDRRCSHPLYHSINTGRSFSGKKRQGREVDHAYNPVPRIRTNGAIPSLTPIRLHFVHRDNLWNRFAVPRIWAICSLKWFVLVFYETGARTRIKIHPFLVRETRHKTTGLDSVSVPEILRQFCVMIGDKDPIRLNAPLFQECGDPRFRQQSAVSLKEPYEYNSDYC